MNNLKNQRGFATLEILLVAAIITILSTVAVPKMARILDKVCLDYELKHLYSDLNFARSIGKSSSVNGGIFQLEKTYNPVEFWIYSKNYSNVSARNRYQIMRPAVTGLPYYRHNLSNEINLSLNMSGEYGTPLKINCYVFSEHRTITLNSKFGDKAEIRLDTVGRIRGIHK